MSARRLASGVQFGIAAAAVVATATLATCGPSPAPLAATATHGPLAQDRDGWVGRSIYFVVTDRFANGDPRNDNAGGFASDLADRDAWHGGDLAGLTAELDYIANMGFTAIWLTPVIEQHDRHAYHGYWGWNFRAIDPHLGDLAALQHVVAEAHRRGIAVMLDTVANHTGRYGDHTPSFPDAAMYHHHGSITNWDDPVQRETFDVNGLDDLAQENGLVRHALLDDLHWLRAITGADGVRIDTAKHVPREFLHDYAAAAGVFAIGEILHGDVAVVAPYTQAIDAVLDYPLFFQLRKVFAAGESARLLSAVLARDAAYAHPLTNGVFIDNHDQPRFLCAANGATAADKLVQLRLALAFAFAVRGIPIVYYGTEASFGDCANNRADMFGRFDPRVPLYGYIHQLNAIRTASPALRGGTQLERFVDDTGYAFERDAGASVAVVAFNLALTPRTFELHDLHAPAGTVLRDVLAGELTVTADVHRSITIVVPARSAVILTTAAP